MDPYMPAGFAGAPDMAPPDDRPPPFYEPNAPSAPPAHQANLPVLTEEDVKEALAQFVSEHCCYGNKPLRAMVIRSIEPATTYHLHLDSFMESRSTYTAEEPYDGSFVDGDSCGPQPCMWTIQIFHTPFQDGTKETVMPHSARIIVCSGCAGIGRKPCTNCSGLGRLTCTRCTAPDYAESRCHTCNNTGHKLCGDCNGVGQKLCQRCKGHGRMKTFLRIKSKTVTYKVDFVLASDRSVPSERIVKRATGSSVYHDEGVSVQPIAHFPHPSVVQLSNRAVAESFDLHRNERMLRQRQTVKAIPVTEVVSTYKEQSATFYVYGLNNKVYFPDYFDKCGCAIL